MIILGIDPGYAIVGFGVISYNGSRFKVLEYGAITTDKNTPFPERLNEIYDGMNYLLDKYQPAAISIEKLYFNTNTTTAISVAQARGVCVLAGVKHGVEIAEYTPLQVKMAVTGYGRAEKHQIMEMTKTLLSLKEIPKPDDAADALAIAICHAHTSGSIAARLGKL
ncbi:MAG: crossover junction endodeoxyribonuclease RuvC [Acutalibacteraceae bacterium]|nr:crossover junction endodeoxyribonuclease RuvC [Clostridia bacterium]MEE1144941.1 crossover junction endodeoxyribonuclease RuvC [Acutalibacteraceae bacterium]